MINLFVGKCREIPPLRIAIMGLKQQLRRTFRGPGKYAQAVWRWKRFSFTDAPPIFGNSKPKSGSHLLLQILNGFTQIMPYTYVEAEPVRTISKDGGRRTGDHVLDDLRQFRVALLVGAMWKLLRRMCLFCASRDA